MAGTDGFTASWCVLRTPLLPLAELAAWSAGLAAPGAAEADLAAALTADRARLRSRLAALLARPEVREAMFVASPVLDEGIAAWQRDPDGKKGRRAEQTLVRYFTRMAARATPFGLFAGFALAPVGETTRLTLAPRGAWRRVTRLDMDYLSALAEALGRDPALRRELRLAPNTSLHLAAGRWRYVESRLRERSRSHHLVTVESTPYLDAALARAQGGARLAEIAAAVAAADPDGEITADDAAGFVSELIDLQLLVPELAPPVTGPEPLAALQATLAACPAGARAADRLAGVQAELARLDAAGLGQDPARYRALAARLADQPAEPQLSRLFQIDLFTRADGAALGRDVVAEIARGVEVLRRLAGSRDYDPLRAFREAFASRWGEGREVPLLAALDDETGIPIEGPSASPETEASPLLRGIAFAGAPAPTAASRWRPADAWLLGRLAEVWRRGERELALTAADLEQLALADSAPLPAAFHAAAVLAATGPGPGDFEVFLVHASGPAGVRMVGRFCHGDPEVRAAVEQHLRDEEAADPEALHAEVVHLPEGRVGNILCRPVLRGWEIPYLGRSGAPPERQIAVDDLLVTVVGDRVILRSRSLGRRIEPRLTNSHNYDKGLAVYRFLCSVQQQGVAHGVLWSWGVWSQAPFTPRVRLGRLVLTRARWRVEPAELRALAAAPDDAGRWRAVQAWRARRGLPRWVALSEYDNELLVDLDNVLALDSFLETAKGRPEVLLIEPFVTPDEPGRLCARGPEGAFVHELFIPFEGAAPAGVRRPLPVPFPEEAPRTFPPGAEWLFAKLYTGSATADRVLREVVAPVRAEALASGLADGWFFLRYGDPDWHLRLRFHGDPERLRAELWPLLAAAAAPLQRDGAIWKLQLDTYEREVERYGGPAGVRLAERLFEADSEAVLALLEDLQGDAGADERWRLALLGVDRLLGDLALPLAERLEVVRAMRNALEEEMRAGKPLRLSLDRRFRAEKPALEALLRVPAEGPPAAALQALDRRSARSAPLAAELRDLAAAGRLGRTVPELARSYVHMHVNRMVRAAARPHELVLYDFLTRVYESRLARGGA